MNTFWIDTENNYHKNYQDLVHDLNSLDSINHYVYAESTYDLILQIIAGLIGGKHITLLDNDFSNDELSNLGIDMKEVNNSREPVCFKLQNYDNVLDLLSKNSELSAITLFTSGTTGRPKKVTHTLKNLARNIKKGSRFEKNTWAFAYNLTHFAGLQVLLQAMFNMNPLIYVFESAPFMIIENIRKYVITNISATPSFYRMILPVIDDPIDSVSKVTMGGEKFDPQLLKAVNGKFPNAGITNIYASTEAGSLFHSDGETFRIEDNRQIEINENNELLIHKDLLGESDSFVIDGDWYNTGDIVERTAENKFKFVARKNEFISIGGYKVNPLEIEDKIKELDFILDVKILSRQNSLLGQVLVANIVIDSGIDRKKAKKLINDYLKGTLQKWKVPSIYNFTDKLTFTRTGKKQIS